MARWLATLLLAWAAPLCAQDSKQPPPKQEELKRERPQPSKGEIAVPPEEDESIAPREYGFNPLQAQKELRVGDYYAKQRNFRAALNRYREATRWNEKSSEAWLRLAEAAEKTKDRDIAREAYRKYLVLEPEAKDAPEVKKKLARLK